jgi:MarR family transcriptional regulator, transcriptional regulator for hemolysin
VSEPSPFRYERAEESPGLQLWKLTRLWQDGVVTALQPFGRTQTQYAILASLRWFEEQGLQPTQRHLGDHANIDKMTLSKAIRRLEAAGLVTRRGASHDGRATQIGFTARGRRTIAKAVVAVENADEIFFAGLDANRLHTWLSLTGELIGQQAIIDPAVEM